MEHPPAHPIPSAPYRRACGAVNRGATPTWRSAVTLNEGSLRRDTERRMSQQNVEREATVYRGWERHARNAETPV